ncbi:MAG: 4Fe-4S dicluster domain-containing protein, partial [Clostridia bacterium]|nr:4Fe-4S dicluster domain-containing protein [Clostridia bacterium]
CARMVLMLGRAPTKKWLSDEWQKEMAKINDCINCGRCKSRCPYGLDVPNLLKQNLEGYNRILQEETNKK